MLYIQNSGDGDEDEIKSIENIKDEVSEITIETFMDAGDDDTYDELSSHNFSSHGGKKRK
ncbi:MAG: hypothetical protein PUB48_00915 [Solobacterium sp.]|nr:hypothetical protein [Solobacterium sp.]